MNKFEDTDEQDDLYTALVLLSNFIEFVKIQEDHDMIDGANDPTLLVEIAEKLLYKYSITEDDSFMEQA